MMRIRSKDVSPMDFWDWVEEVDRRNKERAALKAAAEKLMAERREAFYAVAVLYRPYEREE